MGNKSEFRNLLLNKSQQTFEDKKREDMLKQKRIDAENEPDVSMKCVI
jgi:hypothetical protein